MSYTILIYNYSPENIKIFKIPDETLSITDDDMLVLSHGHMVNTEDLTEALEFVQACVADPEEESNEDWWTFESSKKAIGRFLPYLVYCEEDGRENNIRIDAEISKIISTGFML